MTLSKSIHSNKLLQNTAHVSLITSLLHRRCPRQHHRRHHHRYHHRHHNRHPCCICSCRRRRRHHRHWHPFPCRISPCRRHRHACQSRLCPYQIFCLAVIIFVIVAAFLGIIVVVIVVVTAFLGQTVFPEGQPVIVALARAAFVLAGFFPLPLSSSSSSPHS